MTVTPAGIPLRIDAPLPLAPPFGLLPTVQVIPDLDEHYLSGAYVHGYPPHPGAVWNPCAAGSPGKDDGDAPSTPLFGAFTAYLAETCTARGIAAPGPAEFAQRARAAFDAKLSGIIEDQLANDTAALGGPHLTDANVTILGSGAVSALEGLSQLELAIGASRQRGVIHADPATVTAWAFTGPALYKSGDGKLRTVANDTLVVSGDGYIGSKPAGQADPTDGTGWAYATGMVQIRRTETRLLPGADEIIWALERTLNDVVWRAEADILVTWQSPSAHDAGDGVQAAVLIDRSK